MRQFLYSCKTKHYLPHLLLCGWKNNRKTGHVPLDTVTALSSGNNLNALQRLAEIGDAVLDILTADGKTHQVGGHAGLLELLV